MQREYWLEMRTQGEKELLLRSAFSKDIELRDKVIISPGEQRPKKETGERPAGRAGAQRAA